MMVLCLLPCLNWRALLASQLGHSVLWVHGLTRTPQTFPSERGRTPVTCPVTNKESLFTSKPFAPISLANKIPTIRASYSAWLLLALKANRRACLISNPFGPSKITPTPLPCWLEEPSTESIHLKPAPSWCVATEESSTTKST